MEAEKSKNDSPNSRFITAGILSVLLAVALFAYMGMLNEVYTYNNVTGLTQFSNDPNSLYDANVNVVFKTTSLSAQNPITVEAKIYPKAQFSPYPSDAWSKLEQKKYLLFVYAKKYPLNPLGDGSFEDANIELVKHDNPQYYFGTGQIIYQFDGNYTFALMSEAERVGHYDSGSSVWNFEEIKKRLVWESSYRIGSSDQTALLKNNGITLATTFVLIGFGYVELRHEINPRILSGLLAFRKLGGGIKRFFLRLRRKGHRR